MPRALLSVSDKSGLASFAAGLHALGWDLLSTGGTAKALRDAGLPVRDVSDVTAFPEMLDGRVKTLHPAVHGGLLARRDLPEHMSAIAEHGIAPIDLVCVNLYPFKATTRKPQVSPEDVIEQIDIGGPSMIRSAAKNFASVTCVVDPADYPDVLAALRDGRDDLDQRRLLAAKVFEHTAAYDAAIAAWFAAQRGDQFPSRVSVALERQQSLRYGENPGQQAAFYVEERGAGLSGLVQHGGKELSFNNFLDLEGALLAADPYAGEICCAIVKHTTPCGLAVGTSALEAYQKALACDPVSAFGSVIAFTVEVDAPAAAAVASLFVECVVAPAFEPEARERLAAKANLRLLELGPEAIARASRQQLRSVLGGVLVQDLDDQPVDESVWQVVSRRQPTAAELEDLRFAWRLVRHVRSNAITVARAGQSLGIGAGQMNRVGSARIALETAGEKARGAVLASDGFFPFDDTVRLAASCGISAVIQPGGSVRDGDSIAACDELGLAMVVTGRRHFLH